MYSVHFEKLEEWRRRTNRGLVGGAVVVGALAAGAALGVVTVAAAGTLVKVGSTGTAALVGAAVGGVTGRDYMSEKHQPTTSKEEQENQENQENHEKQANKGKKSKGQMKKKSAGKDKNV